MAIHRIAADRHLGGDASRNLCSRQLARDANLYGARDHRVHRGDPDPTWICTLERAWSAGDGRGRAHGRRSEREHGNRRPAGDPVLLLVAHQRGGWTRHDHCVLRRNRQCLNGHVCGRGSDRWERPLACSNISADLSCGRRRRQSRFCEDRSRDLQEGCALRSRGSFGASLRTSRMASVIRPEMENGS